MRRRSAEEAAGAGRNGIALLWDESYLWAVMAHRALRDCRLPFDIVSAAEVRDNCLGRYRALFVPGGWASNKLKALGPDGAEAIRHFVRQGGGYAGFCGGAGLATTEDLGLLPIRRKPTAQRVPSFSGRIRLDLRTHPIWQNADGTVFQAWWPSQFIVEDPAVNVLASYAGALPDAFSSDLNVGDVETNGGWHELEGIYGINLDPGRLEGEPAVVEGRYGEGKVVLSLVHFDTPGDRNGVTVLRNLWQYLAGLRPVSPDEETGASSFGREALSHPILDELDAEVTDLIGLGIRNFLWFWRTPLFLQWRRGVRGLEYCTLFHLVREVTAFFREDPAALTKEMEGHLSRIRDLLLHFTGRARGLLTAERLALQSGRLTYEQCGSQEIRNIRAELFSASKSHGGLFKDLVMTIDNLLFSLKKGCPALPRR